MKYLYTTQAKMAVKTMRGMVLAMVERLLLSVAEVWGTAGLKGALS